MKALKFLIAVLLWLPCAALTLTLYSHAAALGLGHGPWLERPFLWIAMGFGCWLAVFGLIGPSARAYIISHELTHAIWTLLMGGRVSGFKAGAQGGHIQVSKENWLITLSPYFVPFYTLLVIGLYYLAGVWQDVRPFARAMFYLVGFTWSFHLSYTLAVLRQSQSDVRRHGWVFSMTVIYGMNLLVVALLLAALSPRVTLVGLAAQFGADCGVCWQLGTAGWAKCHALWQQAVERLPK
ncbi:MAG: hypothetical protein HZA91_15340 [Verrucomicrobia bacterium]|nr:hypothetical protein [Verrucomicrobiota bacterium]